MEIRDLFMSLILVTLVGMGMSFFYADFFSSVSGISTIDTSTIKAVNFTHASLNLTKQVHDIQSSFYRKVNILGFDVPYVDIISGGYAILLMFFNLPNILQSLLTDIAIVISYGDWGWAIDGFITIFFIFIIFEILATIFRR